MVPDFMFTGEGTQNQFEHQDFVTFFGGVPSFFWPFLVAALLGLGLACSIFSSTVPLVFLSHFLFASFFALLCANFPLFSVLRGGRFPFVQISPPFLFREPFEGPIWSCWPQKRTFFGGGGQAPRSLWPFLRFLRIFMENCLAIVAPQSNINEKHHDSPSCKASCPKPPSHP